MNLLMALVALVYLHAPPPAGTGATEMGCFVRELATDGNWSGVCSYKQNFRGFNRMIFTIVEWDYEGNVVGKPISCTGSTYPSALPICPDQVFGKPTRYRLAATGDWSGALLQGTNELGDEALILTESGYAKSALLLQR